MTNDSYRFGRFRPEEQVPPDPTVVTDQVIERFKHVLEVDPSRMSRFRQQHMPAWDTQRIVEARLAHLESIHGEFADEVLLAGEGPDPGPDTSDETTIGG